MVFLFEIFWKAESTEIKYARCNLYRCSCTLAKMHWKTFGIKKDLNLPLTLLSIMVLVDLTKKIYFDFLSNTSNTKF